MQEEKRKGRRVLIVGGGASGLMAAVTAARNGAKVTVLECQAQVGKKLLVTGNGRCNLSNEKQEEAFYHCGSQDFPPKALSLFGLPETLDFFRDLGVYVKSRKGYLYPHSDQASSVAEALRMEAEHLRVKLSCNTEILQVGKGYGGFFVRTPGWTYEAEALILACGSLASGEGRPEGYAYARAFGHKVTPLFPALAPLQAGKDWPCVLAGVRVEAKVRLYGDGKLLAEDRGEVQLTAYGISGIPVFQVSRFGAQALEQGMEVRAELGFLPSFSREQLEKLLAEQQRKNPYKTGEAWLAGLLPGKLIPVLLKRAGIQKGRKCADVSGAELKRLLCEISCFQTPITGTRGFSQAQVCAGGVDVEQIDPRTMESRLEKGLFIVGELLDVDGACGGDNLQWAWTSGYLAGRAAANPETKA